MSRSKIFDPNSHRCVDTPGGAHLWKNVPLTGETLQGLDAQHNTSLVNARSVIGYKLLKEPTNPTHRAYITCEWIIVLVFGVYL